MGENMKTLQEQFENLPEIKRHLIGTIFKDGKYESAQSSNSVGILNAKKLNLASYAFQEQQNKINLALTEFDRINKLIEANEHKGMDIEDIGFDKIEKILRG